MLFGYEKEATCKIIGIFKYLNMYKSDINPP